jgi:signal transduction histidine kinase
MLNAAHDLRNYFTVIEGRCEQAARGQKDPLWCIGEIQKALKLCNGAVDAMFTRAPGGGVASTLCSRFGLDLNEVAGEVAASLLLLPSINRMTIQAELKLDLLPLPKGSAWELDRAVRNLCLNAQKAIAFEHPVSGGILKIRTADDAERVWLAVEDNGCGLSAEELARVLHTENDPAKEHGRGLWIVRSTAKELGCELLCESELGKGTTFMLVWRKGTTPTSTPRAASAAA